ENRYFMPSTSNPVFVRDGTVIGVNICEDIWYSGGPVEDQVLRGGAEIVINVSASPYHAGKAQQRKRMLCTCAADTLVVVAYVNLVGGQDEVVYDGCSLIIDQQGQVLAEGAMFTDDLVIADVSLDDVFNARLHNPLLRKGRALDGGEPAARIALGRSEAGDAHAAVAVAAPARPALARRPAVPERTLAAEVYDALVLGTRDYVRKNDFESVVLGLSGGVDSALCACIAADALGAGRVIGVAMPSRFTSDASKEDAASLAATLGIRLLELPIEDIFDSYLRTLTPKFDGRPLDITEENIQARIRGNELMALSN